MQETSLKSIIIVLTLLSCLIGSSKLRATSLNPHSGLRPDTLLFQKYGPDWPKSVEETSGLMFFNGLVWTHNDSFNKPFIYGLKPGSWKVKSRIKVKGGSNYDWEDITLARNGFILGDVGDNRGKRDHRILLHFNFPKKGKCTRHVKPVMTRFTFDGEMFKDPPGNMHNRDIEALAWINDRLFMFTKNRKDHLSYILAMDAFPPDTVLAPIGVLQAGGLITGAEYNADQDLLVLTGYARQRAFLYIVPGFIKSGMESEKGKRVVLQGLDGSQIEGITWIGEDSLLISTEKTAVFNQAGFLIPINHLANNPQLDTELMLNAPVFVRQVNWISTTMIEARLHAKMDSHALVEIIATDGTLFSKREIQLPRGDTLLSFDNVARPARGSVFIRIRVGDISWSTLIQDM